MIEFGYIPRTRNRPWFYPDIREEELQEPISQYTRERYLREIFFMNQGKRQAARFALEQRVKQYMASRITSVSDEDLWEEARQRESQSLRELQAVSSFQTVDEQGPYTGVVRGMRYTPTGTPRRRIRVELTGDSVPIDRDQTEPSVSAINVGALRAPTSGDDRYCMLDSGANVVVIPRMEGMVGDETMCSLVGDNRATGLIVSRLYIGTKSYLVVAVQNAAVLLPPIWSALQDIDYHGPINLQGEKYFT